MALSPALPQAIIWTDNDLLLFRPLGTLSEILIKIQIYSFKKMQLKIYIVYEMAAILSWPQFVNSLRPSDADMRQWNNYQWFT